MRQNHLASDKLFVDFAGQTLAVIDPATGEVWPAQVFVTVLGASSLTYAESGQSGRGSVSAPEAPACVQKSPTSSLKVVGDACEPWKIGLPALWNPTDSSVSV
jgi:hypothetical protein